MPRPARTPSRLWVVLGITLIACALSVALPDISLNSGLADGIVLVTNTGAWPQLAIIAVLALALVVSRHGIGRRRRRIEAGVGIAVMLVVLAGNVALNEFVVKPFFAVARPNIETLVDLGVLGDDVPDADSFYATGGKGARREVLDASLTTTNTAFLSTSVRAHWAHETGYSFPSGHATAAMTVAALLAALGLAWLGGGRRTIAIVVLPIWAVAVVYSRVLLDVHTPLDVTVGTLAGFAWGLAAFVAITWLVTRAAAEQAAPTSAPPPPPQPQPQPQPRDPSSS